MTVFEKASVCIAHDFLTKKMILYQFAGDENEHYQTKRFQIEDSQLEI